MTTRKVELDIKDGKLKFVGITLTRKFCIAILYRINYIIYYYYYYYCLLVMVLLSNTVWCRLKVTCH